MAALRLKLWWINLSTGKKTLIIFLSSFLVLVTAIAIAIPVTMAVIEEMNTHRPVPGTYVTQDEGATATLVLRKEEDLTGSQRRVDYVLPSDDQYLRKDEKCLVNAFSFHGGGLLLLPYHRKGRPVLRRALRRVLYDSQGGLEPYPQQKSLSFRISKERSRGRTQGLL